MTTISVWEFFGNGDPFFGGSADDRVLYLRGMVPVFLRSWEKTGQRGAFQLRRRCASRRRLRPPGSSPQSAATQGRAYQHHEGRAVMSRPAHFDLASAEQAIRSDMRNITAKALRLASTDEDRAMVRLQEGLQDLVVAFALWDMRRINNGGLRDDPVAAHALGYTLGNLVASFVNNSGGNTAILDEVMDRLWNTACMRLSGDIEQDAVQSQTVINATQGGNA